MGPKTDPLTWGQGLENARKTKGLGALGALRGVTFGVIFGISFAPLFWISCGISFGSILGKFWRSHESEGSVMHIGWVSCNLAF